MRITLSMPADTAGLDKIECAFTLRKDEHMTEAFRVIEAGKIKLNEYLTQLIDANPVTTKATESSASRKRPAKVQQPMNAVDAGSSSEEAPEAETETETVIESAQ